MRLDRGVANKALEALFGTGTDADTADADAGAEVAEGGGGGIFPDSRRRLAVCVEGGGLAEAG